jgi:hypothetical protein
MTRCLMRAAVLLPAVVMILTGGAVQPVEAGQATSLSSRATAARPVALDAGGPIAAAASREAARLALRAGDVANGEHQEAHRGWIARHPVLFSSAVGAAVGAAWGLAISDAACPAPSKACSTRGEAVPFLAILGAGAGALTGVVIDHARK